MSSGVYAITNQINGRRYVGSAVDLMKRWMRHRCDLRKGVHHGRYLQRAWDKHGEGAFAFDVMLYCDKDRLLLFEQRAMDVLRPAYNILPKAGSCLGVRRTDEQRARQSARQRGKSHAGYKHTLEQNARHSAVMTGRKQSPDTIAKRAAANTGKKRAPMSPEWRAKISAAMMGDKRNLGRKHTAETRAKNSASKRGQAPWNKGKTTSADVRAKQSASAKLRWAKSN